MLDSGYKFCWVIRLTLRGTLSFKLGRDMVMFEDDRCHVDMDWRWGPERRRGDLGWHRGGMRLAPPASGCGRRGSRCMHNALGRWGGREARPQARDKRPVPTPC